MLFAYDIFHSIKLYYDINLLKLPDMFHKNLLLPLLLAFSIQANSQSHTKFVDPYIGSAAHGHVFVGANVPFGAVQLGPNNIVEGWDWCSGYHYSSSNITGFSHTHLSGTGIGDLGDVNLMPATGDVIVKTGSKEKLDGYISSFSHDNEKVRPGYYSVLLDKYKIQAELTATERVGFHKYIFPANAKEPHVIVDLGPGIGWDAPVETYIKKIDETTLGGYRLSTGWAKDQRIFFIIKFSQPFTSLQLFDDENYVSASELKSKIVKASVNYNRVQNNKLQLKVAISPVSINNALENLTKELPGWDFGGTVKKADEKWNKELGRIKISADEKTMRVFYTAMYHSMIAPSLFNDANNEYRGTDKKVYSNPGFQNYTTFSLWDTYRAWHPLATIIHPEKINDYVKTFLAIYKQQGKLPVWHLHGNETNTMVGYHAVPVIVDAYLKGFRDYDVNLAYEAVKQSAMQQTLGLNYVQKLQHIPADSTSESVAMALEYAIDDWGIAQMAKALGKTEDYNYFMNRSKLYELYFSNAVGFMRGKLADGSWRTPFDPFVSIHRKDDFVEGNAWQYTWLVPHDVEGLIKLFGSEEKFIGKFDSLFIAEGSLGEEKSNDITGLIGQYAHGNEPSHHVTYMYSIVGQPWKTANLIRKIDNDFYTDKTDGLCGNEDVGQMSAWYIFSAMGFYPMNPMNGAYVFGSPLINSAIITLAGNKTFTVKAANNSVANKYIQKVTLNGKPYSKSFITHKEITKGGSLVFYMGNKPSKFGTQKADRPVSNKMY